MEKGSWMPWDMSKSFGWKKIYWTGKKVDLPERLRSCKLSSENVAAFIWLLFSASFLSCFCYSVILTPQILLIYKRVPLINSLSLRTVKVYTRSNHFRQLLIILDFFFFEYRYWTLGVSTLPYPTPPHHHAPTTQKQELEYLTHVPDFIFVLSAYLTFRDVSVWVLCFVNQRKIVWVCTWPSIHNETNKIKVELPK